MGNTVGVENSNKSLKNIVGKFRNCWNFLNYKKGFYLFFLF